MWFSKIRIRPSLILLLLIGLISNSQEPDQVVNNSQTAFTVSEKDLLPESIAYDPVEQNFYLGSTRKGKIIRFSSTRETTDFIRPRQDGLWMIIGMKVDPSRRILWVCSSGGENLEDYMLNDAREGRPAGIFKYNLDTGKLIRKYVLDKIGEVHFFNDLIVANNGDVYATHMFDEHAIYKISNKNDVLEKFISSENIKYPNGLAFSDDGSKLYVAHSEGIAIINLENNKVLPLKVLEGLKISRRESIDGLYCHKNTLIGVQPDIHTIQRFFLSIDGTEITSSQRLEVNHPMMNNPTTGEIVQDHFYYIANAQFGSFNEDGSIYPMERLYEPVILKVNLDD